MKNMILAMGEVLLNIFVILGILIGIISILDGAQGIYDCCGYNYISFIPINWYKR